MYILEPHTLSMQSCSAVTWQALLCYACVVLPLQPCPLSLTSLKTLSKSADFLTIRKKDRIEFVDMLLRLPSFHVKAVPFMYETKVDSGEITGSFRLGAYAGWGV